MSQFQRPGGIVEEENAAKLQLGPDFNNEDCLLISELKILLEAQKESKAKDDSRITSLFRRDNLTQFEIAQLCNLSCSDPDEAKALIPSLATKISDEDLDYLLKQMDNLKKFQH
ncbi:RNA polymerase B [Spiromyces aspiralis]|uniref:RNA polymerase B n=1 Tax=Spiromyces aspiralis TaxID=68401 RepID=A0ACC1HHV7_9FUNG|nr:RNA polymerase B [Spiromyces aspiralis]